MISVNNVTVSFGSYNLLDCINFHISDGDKIGLVGKNGAGKSTLMKLITGQEQPTSGSIEKPSGVRIGYLPQIMEHHRGHTVLEEVLSVFNYLHDMESELARITAELGEREDYESAEYARLIDRLNELNDRLAAGDIAEVILALSTSMEGETTAYYLYKQISRYPVKVTAIARGVGFGDDLEYTDELTLGRSIANRQLFKP